MKSTYEVRILNQKFHLKTDQTEDQVKKISDYVNKVFHELESKNPNLSLQNLAILGAIHMAETLFAKEETHKKRVLTWKNKLQESLF